MAAIKMPFGKYRGKRLAKVPTDYLVWCRDSCSTVTDELRALIVQELARRGYNARAEAPAPSPAPR